ncbi:MAG: hypothetical protein SGI86_11775 [Deltaproteobacteria bacterium]|nr:hypothetical protein [Deltaproteobacteria bacterium]
MSAADRHTPDSSFNHCETAEATDDTPSLPDDLLDHTLAFAYDFFKAGHYSDAAALCRTLLLADPGYWWCYSLFAAVLQRQGKFRECISMIDRCLRYEPGQAKLLAMKTEVERQLAAKLEKKTTTRPGARRTNTRTFTSTHIHF